MADTLIPDLPTQLEELSHALDVQGRHEPVLIQAAELLRRLQKPEWYYDAEDGENGSDNFEDLLDLSDGPMEVGAAREIERFWIARVPCPSDPDDTEIVRFPTRAAAMAAMQGVAPMGRIEDENQPELPLNPEASHG